jgi:hypothetical protein
VIQYLAFIGGVFKRNWRELGWTVGNAVFAGASLWLAIVQPDHDKNLDLWMGAICYAVFVSVGGYWVWAIFDNADEDALDAYYAELHRKWRLLNMPPVELDPVLNAERK